MLLSKSVVLAASLLVVACGVVKDIGTRAPQGGAPKDGFPRPVYRLEAIPPTLVPPCTEGTPDAPGLCIAEVDSAICVKLPDAEDCDLQGLVEPNPELEYLGWRDYWEWAAVGPDDRTVILAFTLGGRGCSELYDVKVADSEDAVVATLLIGVDASYPKSDDGNIGCPAIARSRATMVVLPSPLGNRKLLDGTKGLNESKSESPKPEESPAHSGTTP